MVIATQNPIEHEGTYPLPVSQLDRFLMRIHLGLPRSDGRGRPPRPPRRGRPVVRPESGREPGAGPRAGPAGSRGPLLRGSAALHRRSRQRYSHAPRRAARMSPRAALALQRAGPGLGGLHGRDYVVPDDVKVLALPVIGHRLELRTARTAGSDHVVAVVNELLAKVPVLEGERVALRERGRLVLTRRGRAALAGVLRAAGGRAGSSGSPSCSACPSRCWRSSS